MPKRSKTIQFSVTNEEAREVIEHYARVKGFHSASNLARFATIQYMSRYPLPSQTPQNGPESIDSANGGKTTGPVE